MADGTIDIQALPAIAGENLAGEPVRFPEALAGRPGILIVGFSPMASGDSERWARWAAECYVPQGGPAVYLLVVVEGPQFLAPIIDGMLRKGSDPKLHRYAVTTYDPSKQYRKRFGVQHDGKAQVFLVDAQGRMRHHAGDGFSPSASAALDAVVSGLKAAR